MTGRLACVVLSAVLGAALLAPGDAGAGDGARRPAAPAGASTAEDDPGVLSRVGEGLSELGRKTVSAGRDVASWIRGLFKRPAPARPPAPGPAQTQAAASPAPSRSTSSGPGSTRSTAPARPAPPQAAAAPAKAADSACRLLTADEVGVVLGGKVSATREATSFSCRYTLGSRAQVEVSLSSPGTDARGSFERERERERGRIELADIGESAYALQSTGGAQVRFLKADTLVEVRVSRARAGHGSPLEEAKLLARTAASRVRGKPGLLQRLRRRSGS
jgi:hypothetical protein